VLTMAYRRFMCAFVLLLFFLTAARKCFSQDSVKGGGADNTLPLHLR
jgi:hypothetical protein